MYGYGNMDVACLVNANSEITYLSTRCIDDVLQKRAVMEVVLCYRVIPSFLVSLN